MANPYTQSGRIGRLKTVLGDDVLLLIELDGTESLSELFSFQLKAVAPQGSLVDIDRLLGGAAAVEFYDNRADAATPTRTVRGIIAAVEEIGADGTFDWYQLELVPAAWPLGRNRRFRIFEDMTSADILAEVLGRSATVATGFPGSVRNYCVQYGESDLAFASRLIEEEGGHYSFPADDELGRMGVGEDSPSRSSQLEIKLPYSPSVGADTKQACVTKWRQQRRLAPASVSLRDRTFHSPGRTLFQKQKLTSATAVGQATCSLDQAVMKETDVYEYPAGHVRCHDAIRQNGGDEDVDSFLQCVADRQQRYAAIRAEEFADEAIRMSGASNCTALLPGRVLRLDSNDRNQGGYLLISVTHRLRMGVFGAEQKSDDAECYANTFEVTPQSLTYRTARRTPRPTVSGHEVATVVGADGSTISSTDDIFTDKYGRVRLRFPWSEDGRNSCWVRVAQTSAGSRQGDIRIPRVGNEVVVGFAHGDPDCPLVYGSVYNGQNLPPHSLPENRYRSGYTSCSSGARLAGSPLAPVASSGAGGDDDSLTSVSDAASSTTDYSSYSGLAIGDNDGSEYLHLRAAGDMLLDTYGDQLFAVQGEQATLIQYSQLNIIGGYRGVAFNFFGSDFAWKWLDPLKISFGDDLWSAVPLHMYWLRPKALTANFGSNLEFLGANRVYAGCTHLSSSSTWNIFGEIGSLLFIDGFAWFGTLSTMAEASGMKTGRVERCGGDAHSYVSGRVWDRAGSGQLIVAGSMASIMGKLWKVYGLLNTASKILTGVLDVRAGTTARTFVELMTEIAQYYGNFLAFIDIFIGEAEKIEAMTDSATTLTEMAELFLLTGTLTSATCVTHVLQLAEDAVFEATDFLSSSMISDTWHSDDNSSIADLYQYSKRHFIVDSQASIYLNAAKRIHFDADGLISSNCNTFGVRASEEIILGSSDGPYISVDSTGVVLYYDADSYIDLSVDGININGTMINMTALTSILESAASIANEI